MRPTYSWWALVLRGALLVILGVLAFVAPAPTLTALIAVFAAVAIVDGVLALVAGFSVPHGPRWWIVLAGAAGVALGVFTFASPNTTAVALTILVGVWAIVIGAGQLVAAWQLRNVIEGEWVYYLSGAVSVIFGAYLVVSPGNGVLALLWLIGYFAIFFGVMHLYTAWLMRRAMTAMPAA
jgi:uncharacterized membrane protein HdeD (DUF308 family)